jgi:acetylornithine/succinyldiaminopimelate/putrescine aminotransferase
VTAHLFNRLRALAAESGGAVIEVRGAGFIAGLELAFDAAPVTQAALERGLLVNRTSTSVVRLLPPYVITERDVDEAIPILQSAIAAAAGRRA